MCLTAELKHALRKLKLNIHPDWLVLDVGSGNNPHFRADILCDKYIDNSSEREGALAVDRPVVQADVQKLPFKDGAFDYVICSHLLEHVEDPEQAVRELTRIAPRGYIETPSEFSEKMGGAPFHRWFVRQDNGVLFFTEKVEHPYDKLVGGTLYQLQIDKDPAWSTFMHKHYDLFVSCLEWEQQVPMVVKRARSAYVMPEEEIESKKVNFCHFGAAKRLLRSFAGGRARIPKWTDILQSTCCNVLVKETESGFMCTNCNRVFSLMNGLPCFIE